MKNLLFVCCLACINLYAQKIAFNLFSNYEVLAIDQHMAGKGSKKIEPTNEVPTLGKELADGSKAIAKLNLGKHLIKKEIHLDELSFGIMHHQRHMGAKEFI